MRTAGAPCVRIPFGSLREIVLPRGKRPDAEHGPAFAGDDASSELDLRLYQNQYSFQILNKNAYLNYNTYGCSISIRISRTAAAPLSALCQSSLAIFSCSANASGAEVIIATP